MITSRCLSGLLFVTATAQLLVPQGTFLPIPDVEVPIELLGISATIQAYGITCGPIDFGDVRVSLLSADDLSLSLLEFSTPCDFEYSYTSAFASNTGAAKITTERNALHLVLHQSRMECNAAIQTQNITFQNEEPLQGVFDQVIDTGIGGVSLDAVFGESICDYFRNDERALDSFLSTDPDFSLFDLVAGIARDDPTSVEDEEAFADTTTLVNFQDVTPWPGGGVRLALDGLSYLDTTLRSDEDVSYLNQLWEMFLDDRGVFRWDVSFEFSSDANSTLLVNSLEIVGVSDALRGIQAVGKHTLQIDVLSSDFTVTLSGLLRNNADDTAQNVSVDANVTTLDGAFAFYLPVDEVTLGSIPISSLLDTETATMCLGSTILGLAIADTQVRSLQFSPSTSPDWGVIEAAGIVLDLETLLNGSPDTATTTRSSSDCTRPRYFNSDSAFLDFRDLFLTSNEAVEYGTQGLAPYGNTLSTVKSFADDALGRLSTDPSGISIDGPIVLASGTQTSEGSSFFFSLDALRLSLADQTPSYVLEPLRNQSKTITNSLSLSMLDIEGGVGLKFEELSVNDDWSFHMRSESVALFLQTTSSIFEQAFLDFPLQDVLNINCWMATIPQSIESSDFLFAIERSSAELGALEVSLRCNKCHKTAASAINFTVDPSMGFQASVDEFFSGFQGREPEIQTFLVRSFQEAPLRCPHHPNFDPTFATKIFKLAQPPNITTSSATFATIISFVAFTLFLAGLYHFVQPVLIRRNRTGAHVTETIDDIGSPAPIQNELYSAPSTRKRVVVSVLVVLSNILFILGTTQKSYLFRLYFDVAEKHFMALDIGYSTTQLVRDFWVGGGWMFASEDDCSSTSTNAAHLELSELSWKVGDRKPLTTTDGLAVVRARGLMPPVYGIFLWAFAQLISQWCGEAILQEKLPVDNNCRQMYTKGLAKTESSMENDPTPVVTTAFETGRMESDSMRNSLSKQVYTKHGATADERVKVSVAANVLVMLATILFYVLLGLGISLPYLSVKKQGLLAPSGTTSSHFSIISMLTGFSANAKYSESPSLRFYTGIMSFMLMVVVILVPALEYFCLILLWFRRLSTASFVQLSSAANWLSAFGYTEIFVVAVVIATSQMTMIVEFLVGRNCEALAAVIAVGVDIAMIRPQDAFCYHVVGEVREASVFLLLAAFLLISMRTFVAEAISASLTEGVIAVGEQPFDNEHNPVSSGRTPSALSAVSFPDRFRCFFQPV